MGYVTKLRGAPTHLARVKITPALAVWTDKWRAKVDVLLRHWLGRKMFTSLKISSKNDESAMTHEEGKEKKKKLEKETRIERKKERKKVMECLYKSSTENTIFYSELTSPLQIKIKPCTQHFKN